MIEFGRGLGLMIGTLIVTWLIRHYGRAGLDGRGRKNSAAGNPAALFLARKRELFMGRTAHRAQ